jgi:hypothetical protein
VPTVEQIARTVKSEMDSSVALEVVAQFVSQRIQEVYSKTKYKSLRRYGELNIAATIGSVDGSSGGTVTVIPGSNIVTGDSTAATIWTNVLEGRFFRTYPLKTWYRIARVDAPAKLTLDSPVSTERNTDFTLGVPIAGQSYYIAQKFIPVAPDARYLGQFVLPYLYQPVNFISPEEMNRRFPSRYLVGPYPWVISEFGSDWGQTNKPKIVEVYPYSVIATVLGYTYWCAPPYLAFDDELPPTLDPHIAREMAMIPVYRYEYIRRLRGGDIQGAEVLKNEFRTQEGKMAEWVDQAIKSDNGTDDLTFIMERWPNRRSADFDPITRASDDVWSRGQG